MLKELGKIYLFFISFVSILLCLFAFFHLQTHMAQEKLYKAFASIIHSDLRDSDDRCLIAVFSRRSYTRHVLVLHFYTLFLDDFILSILELF